jgi:N-dimethylarginine dimethylaminohydrolase
MNSRLSVQNEYARLTRTILGIATRFYWPKPNTVFLKQTSPLWMHIFGQVGGKLLTGRPIPRFFTRMALHELGKMLAVLRNRDIDVLRPAPITPLAGEEPGLSQVFARDPVIAIGDTLVIANQRLPMLRKEIRGFAHITDMLKRYGCRILRVPQHCNIFLEGGDVLIDLPYVFVGVGNLASNDNGAEWLAGQLGPRYRVVAVRIIRPGIFHLDTCMTLIGDKKGIICRSALQNPLPAPLDSYEFFEVDEKVRRQIGTNILMLDEKTIIIQKRHAALGQILRSRGYEVIALDFKWHALGGGAFRCVTHPLVRDNG